MLGGAWLVGGLRALERSAGWTPMAAAAIVGTSSGALVGALIAAGLPATDLLSAGGPRILGAVVEAEGVPGFGVDLGETLARYVNGWATRMPGSWALARSELRRPRPRNLLKVLSGLLPEGSASTDGIRDVVRRWTPNGWPLSPRLWVVTCDYMTGERVVFGRHGAPAAHLPQAVAASCAMPSYYQPVTIAGRVLVDGAVHSASNLDLLRGRRLDLVVAFNPLSSRAEMPGDALGRIVTARRRLLSRRLEREAAVLRAAGTRVLLIEPAADDLVARGRARRIPEQVDDLARLAEETVAEQLGSPGAREQLAGLDLVAAG